jgi:hypothetical protein
VWRRDASPSAWPAEPAPVGGDPTTLIGPNARKLDKNLVGIRERVHKKINKQPIFRTRLGRNYSGPILGQWRGHFSGAPKND